MIPFELFLEMWNKSNSHLMIKSAEHQTDVKHIKNKISNPSLKVSKTDVRKMKRKIKIVSSISQEIKRRSSKFKNSNLSKK